MANENNQVEIWEDEEEYYEDELPERNYIFKCKPCYNFQSVEFEYNCAPSEIPQMMEIYKMIIDELQKIAPEQIGSKQAPSKPVEMATENQYKLMKKLGIEWSKPMSKEEARKVIARAMKEYWIYTNFLNNMADQ